MDGFVSQKVHQMKMIKGGSLYQVENRVNEWLIKLAQTCNYEICLTRMDFLLSYWIAVIGFSVDPNDLERVQSIMDDYDH